MLTHRLGALALALRPSNWDPIINCRSFASEAQSTIAYWQEILTQKSTGNNGNSGTAVQTHELKRLLQEAITLYSAAGAMSPIMPEEITNVFIRVYRELLDPAARVQFFSLLARDFGVQGSEVDQAVAAWQRLQQQQPVPAPEAFTRVAARLRSASEPLYMSLFPPISQHRQGIPFLVKMRGDLQECIEQHPAESAGLRALSQDLRRALSHWFSLGLLELRRVTWAHSSAQLLERVQRGEAVHPMTSLEQLKQRLNTPDRRCFCFFHPSLPDVPLVILHTALMPMIPSSMEQVLGDIAGNQQHHEQGLRLPTTSGVYEPWLHQQRGLQQDDQQQQHKVQQQQQQQQEERLEWLNEPHVQQQQQQPEQQPFHVACFYSISSTQPGLAGVDLGNFLIKKVARELLGELPHLCHLVTLSPVPGFRAWLQLRLEQQVVAEQEVDSSASNSSSSSSSRGSSSSGSSSDSSNEVNVEGAQLKAAVDPLLMFQMLLQDQRTNIQACWELIVSNNNSSRNAGSSSSSSGSATRGSVGCNETPGAVSNTGSSESSSSSNSSSSTGSDDSSGGGASGSSISSGSSTDCTNGSSSSSVGSSTCSGGSSISGTGHPTGRTAGSGSSRIRSSPSEMLLQLLRSDGWLPLPPQVQQQQLAPLMIRLCAVYLVHERRRSLALDPVANFHLRNGAELWRVNFGADMSAGGLARSHGLMVNYKYELQKVAERNRAYLVEHKIAVSEEVEQLLS